MAKNEPTELLNVLYYIPNAKKLLIIFIKNVSKYIGFK